MLVCLYMYVGLPETLKNTLGNDFTFLDLLRNLGRACGTWRYHDKSGNRSVSPYTCTRQEEGHGGCNEGMLGREGARGSPGDKM